MIQPTVGRIVWYRPKGDAPIGIGAEPPRAAIITFVHSSWCVNLAVYDANGEHHSRASVTLVQPDSECPEGAYCEWMPYQVKKDHGSESGEKAAGTQQV